MTRRCMIAMLILLAAAVRPAAAGSCSGYASTISFPDYHSSTVDITGSVTVTCSSGTSYHIGLNAGITPGATINNRLMFGGDGGQNTLGYQLFSDAAHALTWGNSSGTNWVSGTGNGNSQQYTIYARIPGGQSSDRKSVV